MKITVSQEALVESLGLLNQVIERRQTIPILSNALIKGTEMTGNIQLRATNLDQWMTVEIEGEVETEGALTLPCRALADIVGRMPKDTRITIETARDRPLAEISGANGQFRLVTLPFLDMPPMGEATSHTHHFALPAAKLSTMFNTVAFAISTEETRYYLNGIYLEAGPLEMHGSDEETHLIAVATNGHQLARMAVEIPEGAAGMPAVIVPRPAVHVVQRLIAKRQGDVDISIGDATAGFHVSGITFGTKLIEATFPDYRRILPDGERSRLRTKTRHLDERLGMLAPFWAKDRTGFTWQLGQENGHRLQMANSNLGDGDLALEAEWTGDAMSVGTNLAYVRDYVGQMAGEEIDLFIDSPGAPILLRDPAEESFLGVLMPMRA